MHTEILAQGNEELSGIFIEWCRSCYSGHDIQRTGESRERKSTCQGEREISTSVDDEIAGDFLQKNK